MSESRTQVLLLMLMGVVILLMVAIVGLFVRMNQLQQEVLAALKPVQTTRRAQGLEIGTQVPDFTLPDVEGRMVSFTDFAGQKVLLTLSSIRCPHCTEMYPHLKAFSEEANEIQVVMISRGSPEENHQLVEEQGFAFPVLTWDDQVAQGYQVPGTPFFYVIDGEGTVTNKRSAKTQEQLEALVAAGGK